MIGKITSIFLLINAFLNMSVKTLNDTHFETEGV